MSLSINTGGFVFGNGITLAIFHSIRSTPSLSELLKIAEGYVFIGELRNGTLGVYCPPPEPLPEPSPVSPPFTDLSDAVIYYVDNLHKHVGRRYLPG